MQVFIAASIAFLFFVSILTQAVVQDVGFVDTGLDNLQFLDSVLFISDKVRSKLDCVRLCGKMDHCATVTYIRGSSGRGSCLGHSVAMTTASAASSASGTKTYLANRRPGKLVQMVKPQTPTVGGSSSVTDGDSASLTCTAPSLPATGATYEWFLGGVAIAGATTNLYTTTVTMSDDGNVYTCRVTVNGVTSDVSSNAVTLSVGWLDKACVTSATCPAANSLCFGGLCLCTPGFFYSTGTRTCVDTCAQSDLGATFLKYPQSVLWVDKLDDLISVTLDLCQTVCVGNPRCLTLEIWNGDECILTADTALLQPSHWEPETVSVSDHYQRTCA